MRNSKLSALTALAGLSAALLIGAPAHAADPSPLANDSMLETFVCDSYTPSNDQGLVKVDPVTLEGTQMGASPSHCGAYSYNSVSFNPFDGKIYGQVTYSDGVGPDHFHIALATMNLSGVASSTAVDFTADTAPGVPIKHSFSVAINPLTGDGYAYDSATATMYSINLATAVMHLLATTTSGADYAQMAYSPDGNLYAYDSNSDQLVTLDPTTLNSTVVQNNFSTLFPPNTAWLRQVYGMAFDSTGTLFMSIIGQNSSELWHLSPADSFATPVRVAGANPNAAPEKYIDSTNFWTSSNPQVGSNPITITFGLQKLNFDATTNGGTALSPSYSRFFPPTILETAGLQANAAVTLPAIADRPGFTTDGWFDAATGGNKIGVAGDSYVPSGASDITLYAQFTPIVTTKASVTKTIKGFLPNSSKITAVVAKNIKALTGSKSTVSTVTCTGTTSAKKASAADKALALARGKAACAFFKHLVPGAIYSVAAKPATGVGAPHRAVIITVTRKAVTG